MMAEGGGSLKVASASGLILLQLFTRILTLFMTQMQVRLTSAQILGAANIHFELLLGLILTLSREGFRTALSRTGSLSNTTKNVALLPIPIGIAISTIVISIYLNYLAPSELTIHPHFTWATRMILAGAILELFAEPLYIAALIQLDTMTRVKAEGSAIAAKSATILILLAYMRDSTTLLPFGVGQVAYGITFLTIYWISNARQQGWKGSFLYLQPIRDSKNRLFQGNVLRLSLTMTRQNLVKHALGEGDKFAVARLASLSDQGAYALASNYGSLVARILYQPLEESSRLTFARALGDSKTSSSKGSIDLASNLLGTLLSFYVILSLFLITFCPPYSIFVLYILAGKAWAYDTMAPSILGVYGSTYLPIMAFNGLLEGFFQACATPSQLTRYAFVLVAASGLFVSSLTIFHHFNIATPEKALILATTTSTLARAAYCYHFTTGYLHSKNHKKGKIFLSFRSLFPHPATMSTFALSATIVYLKPYSMETSNRTGLPTKHILAGISCVFICFTSCIIFERMTLLNTLRAIRGKQQHGPPN